MAGRADVVPGNRVDVGWPADRADRADVVFTHIRLGIINHDHDKGRHQFALL